MRQRVALLRAVLPDRDVLLLDEPFKALDAITRSELQQWLSDVLDRSHRATIMVTHDVEEALMLGDRIFVMSPASRSNLAGVGYRFAATQTERRGARSQIRRSQMAIIVSIEWCSSAMSVFPQTEDHVPSENATVHSRQSRVSILKRLTDAVQNWGTAIVIALFGLVIWELSVRFFNVQEWLLPPVSQILSELIADPLLFIENGWVTLREILVGFIVSVTFGFVMATGMFWSRLMERSVYPFLIASQTVPVFTLAPLLVIWTGTGMTPKVVIVVLFTFFPITIGLMTGLRSVDADMIAMFRTPRSIEVADVHETAPSVGASVPVRRAQGCGSSVSDRGSDRGVDRCQRRSRLAYQDLRV